MLAPLAVDAGAEGQVVEGGKFIRANQPWADTARMHEILALGDIELGVAHPVAQGALVHQGEPGDMVQGLVLWNAVPGLADHQYDFALVIQLLGLRRPPQGLPVAREGVDGAHKQAGPLGVVGAVPVFAVAVGIVDADAGDLLGGGDGGQVVDGLRVHIGFQARGALHHVGQPAIPQQLLQAAAEARAQVDQALVRRHPPAGPGVCGERDKAHAGVLHILNRLNNMARVAATQAPARAGFWVLKSRKIDHMVIFILRPRRWLY